MSRAQDALRAQGEVLVAAVAGLADEDLARPSVLAGWRIADLVSHLAAVLEGIPQTARRTTPDKPITVARYVGAYAAAAEQIRTRDLAGAGDPRERLRRGFEQARDTEGTGTVRGARGPIRWDDYLATRVIELVVHTDDLDRSVDATVGVDRGALKVTVGTLAKAFAEKAPGRSVELRIPPYAAVQCVEGPRHTRGTPPNVVETDALTWVRLAAGRLGWHEAVAGAKVRASGGRADLAEWLPLL